MRLGYSFWGFLGAGVVDTPDGGRSHRRVLIDGLRALGHQVVFLQANRDLDEAGEDLRGTYAWDLGFPPLDALVLEWRWPIPGRNTGVPCGVRGHTCALHRQAALLDRYTDRGVPTVLWDKDRQLPADHPLRRRRNVQIAEAALWPTPGAMPLLFPIADQQLDLAAVNVSALAAQPRSLPLVYIGNQYDRDDAFDEFFATPARAVPHLVAGKWPHRERWPHVRFAGRIGFPEVSSLYARSLATVLLLPDRYARAGQMTQRIFESVLAGCLPITPANIRGAELFTPAELHVADGAQATALLRDLCAIAGSDRHRRLLAECLQHLRLFRLSDQLAWFTQALQAAAR